MPKWWGRFTELFYLSRSGMNAQPMLVNPDDNERVKIAFYRLDAIRRHREQRMSEGREISATRAREFREEARELAAFLLREGRITPAQRDLFLKQAGGMI